MFYTALFCKRLISVEGLQAFLIPCPFKKLTGFDCPGCGFQRSLLALFQGDIGTSLHLYPATIPVILVFMMGLINWKRAAIPSRFTRPLYFATATLIVGSYLIKMSVYL